MGTRNSISRTRVRLVAASAIGLVCWGTNLMDAGADAALTAVGGGMPREAACAVDIEIAGAVATVTSRHTVTQRGRGDLEAVYTFEVPDDAAVIGATVRLADGAVASTEVIAERAARTASTGARGLSARGARPDVALLRLVERDAVRDPNTPGRASYELRVYPVPANKTIEVMLRWVAPLRMDDDRLVLRVPGRGTAPNLVAEQVSLRLAASGVVKGFDRVFAGGAMRKSAGRSDFLVPQGHDIVVEATPRLATRTRPDLTYATVPIDKDLGVVAVQVWSPGRRSQARLSPDRVVVLVDVSSSMGSRGVAAARTLVGALLASLGEHPRVELVLFDRTVRRVFNDLVANDTAARQRIDGELSGAAGGNGSDLGAALDVTRELVSRADDKRGPGATLVAIITDGLTPLHLDGDRAIDRLGESVLTRGGVFAITVVPDGAPTPEMSTGPLATLAARTAGRSIAVRQGDVDQQAPTLVAELTSPPPLRIVGIEAGKDSRLDALALPERLPVGRSAFAIGFYHGAAPRTLTLSGRVGNQRIAFKGTRDARLAGVALPLAMLGADVVDFVPDEVRGGDERPRAGDLSETSRASAERRYLAAASQAHAVTPEMALVGVHPTDGYARDRLALAKKWGLDVFARMPPPLETEPSHAFRKFSERAHSSPLDLRRTGTLDKAIVERLIRTYVLPKAKACYDRALKRDASLSGAVMLQLELGRGEVQWAEVLESSFPNAGVEQCLAEAAYSIQVPAVAQGASAEDLIVVKYPLSFRMRPKGGTVQKSTAPIPVTVDPRAPL
jgi:Mg-chelatase subunit ChlD